MTAMEFAKANRGVMWIFKSPTGRDIEYTFAGRCDKGDPVMINSSSLCFPLLMGPSWKTFFMFKEGLESEQDRVPFTVLCFNRAGYGRSTLNMPYEQWTYGEYAKDVAALADYLKIGTFSVIGSSSGGPNAMALAAHLRDRVTGLFLSCGDYNYAPGFPKGKKLNETLPLGTFTYVDAAEDGRNCICCPSCQICCCPGVVTKGLVNDFEVEVRPLDWNYDQITCPVFLTQGEKDTLTDPNVARYHAHNLPHARLEMIPEAKHVTLPGDLFFQYMEEFKASLKPPGGGPAQQTMS